MAYAPIYIDDSGIRVNTFADIFAYFTAQMQLIYGADIVLDPSSQDGQLIGIFSKAVFDVEQAAQLAYVSFAPSTATGFALSNNVSINGIARNEATFSTVDVTLIGAANTTIADGVVYDNVAQYKWNLPTPLTIPATGSLTVTATAQEAGAITAAPGTVVGIFTPTSGWTSVSNALAATPGNPVENDAALRVRQGTSVARPSQAIITGLIGDLLDLNGVTSAVVYENPTDMIDATVTPNRLPHSIATVVTGGSLTDVANAIFLRKTLGVNSAGFPLGTANAQVVNLSPAGVSPFSITFYRPVVVTLNVVINIKALANWTGTNTQTISAALKTYLNLFIIGQEAYNTKIIVASYVATIQDTYDVTSVVLSATGKTLDAFGNITVNDNEQITAGTITFNVA